jgi:hypothetical protein
LEISEAILDASHEIQYWQSTRFLQDIGSVDDLYVWLRGQLRNRSATNELPRVVPEICLTSDQLQVLDYWAQGGLPAHVGIPIADIGRQIENLLPIQLDPIADEPLENYLANLNVSWRVVLSEISGECAQSLAYAERNHARMQDSSHWRRQLLRRTDG